MKWRWHHRVFACAAFLAVAGPTFRIAGSDSDSKSKTSPAPVSPSLKSNDVALVAPAARADARSFWSFQPVKSPPVPRPRDSRFRIRNPVDAFVLARLQEKKLPPSPPASRLELIRRLSFDLTGLPPSPEAVQAFLNDRSPDADEQLVERLLESPHFGERWAQHWLDVVRYAETEGFEYDRHLPEAWRYRDYVIQSFQRDKPFNRFLTEQIAGDEIGAALGADGTEGATAAIFHRLGPVRRNAGNPEIALSRNEVLTERTDAIGAAFLGLTVGCARCHDHKFDPISQRDYYQFQAYLAGTQQNDILLVPPKEKKAWEEKTEAINAQLRQRRKAADQAEGEKRAKLNEEIEALENTLPPHPPTIPSIHNDPAQRTEIHVLKRGEWEKKGDAVAPRPLSVLVASGLAELPVDCPNPRTALARWLTEPNHPLTARVMVNRLWQHHFGAGLVRTANDFGFNGERPSHPELLDWLAAELIKSGWRLKHIHRLIVLSSAYQQSSRGPAPALADQVDPENRFLWRFNQRRLSAEEIRDAMLAASGELNPRVGGPSVMVPVDPELVRLLYKPAQWDVAREAAEHRRRSIYLIAKRNLRLPFMETFDQPPLLTSCGRRESSTHAPQALEMLNGQLANGLAEAFARRLETEARGRRQIVERAYGLAIGRPPTARERSLANAFLEEQPLKEFALALFNLNAFLYVQ
jgi:hypothetical protein